MKSLKFAFAACLMGLGLMSTQASASSLDLGEITETGKSGFVVNIGSGITAFEDTITFSLAAVSTTLNGEISDLTNFLGIVLDSLNFKLDLFTTADPGTSLGTFTDVTGTGITFSYLDLASGDYFFRIAGTTGAPLGNGYTYKFNVDVTETPIPPALLLFATALGGLGFAGYRKRKLAATAA